MNQDPEGSGIPRCRKCTYEFLKLDKPEQDLWMEIVQSPGKLEDKLNCQAYLYKVFHKLSYISQENMKLLDKRHVPQNYKENPSVLPIHTMLEERDQQILTYYQKKWNELTQVEQKLLQHYYDIGLTQEELDERSQEMYQTMCMILGYQAYEILELSKESPADNSALRKRKEKNVNAPRSALNITRKTEL